MQIEKGEKFSLVHCIDYVANGVASKQIIKNKGGNITLFAFSVGEGLSEHTAPYDAFVYVLEGITEIHIDKESSILKAGDMILMPAGIPHAIEAKTDFKMLLVMIKPESP
jgi:quercetin dioxygenase-like cupin family protein